MKKYVLIFMLLFIFCSGTGNKSGSLSFITVEEELALGRDLMIEAEKQFELVQNEEIVTFLNQIAQEIGKQSDWNGLTYSVYIINRPDLNHFSLPSGYVYIYRGILEIAETAGEVAMIIAHEIAHIAARDGIRQVGAKYGYAFAAQSIIGENPEITYEIINQLYGDGTILDYNKSREYRADQKAIKYAWKANYAPAEYLKILEKIRHVEESDPERVYLLNTTHPPTISRYKQAKIEIAKAPNKSSLRNDLDNFKKIKEILAGISVE